MEEAEEKARSPTAGRPRPWHNSARDPPRLAAGWGGPGRAAGAHARADNNRRRGRWLEANRPCRRNST